MRLAVAPGEAGGTFRWWSVTPRAGVRTPILGIEIDAPPDATDQWLLSAHGVRDYRSQGSRVIQAGPPVPTFASREGLHEARQWLRLYLPSKTPPHALPAADVERLESMEQLVQTAERQWAGTRADPPAGMTPEQIAAEMEAFPHGLKQLLAVAEYFGG
jgi:hypothetical protein